MFCPNCGTKIPDDAAFCPDCGERIAVDSTTVHAEPVLPVSDDSPAGKGKKVTENIHLGTDGKYHWYYEFKLMKNPTILYVLWKIFFWIGIGIWLFLLLLDLFDGKSFSELWSLTKVFAIGIVGFLVFVAIGYFIYALLQGFKYCVMFEMDEDGVKHTQMPRQFKKAQAMSMVLILAGMAAKSPGAVGQGMLAGSRNCMVSTFSSVKSIEIFRKRNVIKVNEKLNKNQVYAEDADFDFVLDYIKSHITKRCKVYDK